MSPRKGRQGKRAPEAPETPESPAPATQLSAPPAIGPSAVLDPNAPTAGTAPDEESGIDPEDINPPGGESPADTVNEQGDLVNPATATPTDSHTDRLQKQSDAAYVEKRLMKEGWSKLSPPIGKACFHKEGLFASRFGDKVDKPAELDEAHTANLHDMAIALIGKLDTQSIANFVFDHETITKDMMSGALTGSAEHDLKFLVGRPKNDLVGYAAGLELETKGIKEAQLAQMIITAHDIS